MRYAKGSLVVTAQGDIPLLRQVRNSRFISHSKCLNFSSMTPMCRHAARSIGGFIVF